MPWIFVSDHHPFVINTDSLKVFSLNAMFRMKFNQQHQFFNSGFRCADETQIQYSNRLELLGLMLRQNLVLNAVDVFCLQECPQDRRDEQAFTGMISANLGRNFQIETSRGRQRGYYSMTIYNGDRFEKHRRLSENIAAINLVAACKGRVLPVVLLDKFTRKTYLIVNVHGDFKQAMLEDIKLILEAKAKFNIDHLMIVGDFNRNLGIAADDVTDNCQRALAESLRKGLIPEVNAISIPHTCVYFADSGLEIQTRDGAIVSKSMGEVTALTLWQMNRVEVLSASLGTRYAGEAQVTQTIIQALSLAHAKPLSDVALAIEGGAIVPELPVAQAAASAARLDRIRKAPADEREEDEYNDAKIRRLRQSDVSRVKAAGSSSPAMFTEAPLADGASPPTVFRAFENK